MTTESTAVFEPLVARVRRRVPEIQDAILAHIRTLSDSVSEEDPAYVQGLREAVGEALDFALLGIERAEEGSRALPPAVMAQVQRSARTEVRLDTVLRRYAAGDRVLEEFVMGEAGDIPAGEMRQVLRRQATQLDRLMESVADAYKDELERIKRSPGQRLAERVERLLSGVESVPSRGIEYRFDAVHTGVVATGGEAEGKLRALAACLGREVLLVSRGEWPLWAWLGGPAALAVEDIERFLAADAGSDVVLAIGEPRPGLAGWRLSHEEARVAHSVALRRPQPVTRCADVAAEAALLQAPRLAALLVETHLRPLSALRDGGNVARATLRGYIGCSRNVSSSASALGVHRRTVENRLNQVAETLGQSLDACMEQIDLALRLESLGVTWDQQ